MIERIYYFFQKKIENRIKKKELSGYIFMFHNITQIETDDDFSISINNFKKFVLFLKKTTGISTLNNLEFDNFKSYITFDDGYKSVMDLACPFLDDNHIDYALFITTAFINKSNYLNIDDIHILNEKPNCTFGSHSLTHSILRFSKSKKKEIEDCKFIIEEIIKKEVDLFAYPYGSIFACDKKSIRIAKESGYKYAFSTLNSGYTKDSLKGFFIPRINVNDKNFEKIMKIILEMKK